jgi:hypothetical protein
MTARPPLRFDWSAVKPPTYVAGPDAWANRRRFYVANPSAKVSLNAWRDGNYWRWAILVFPDATDMAIYRHGSAGALWQAKVLAEQAVHAGDILSLPERSTLWEQKPDEPVNDLPF